MYSGELEVQAKRKAIAVLQDEINRILNASRELSSLPELLVKKNKTDVKAKLEQISSLEDEVENLKGSKCYYPYYKMFVDWNGDVLFCSNDWGREIIIGNLLKQSLYDVWMSDKMKEIRDRLSKGDRSSSPCNKCSVGGTLFGQPSFDLINEYYESSDNGTH